QPREHVSERAHSPLLAGSLLAGSLLAGSAGVARIAGEVIAWLIPLRVALAFGVGLTRRRGVACALLGVGLILCGLIGGVRGLVVRGLRRGVLGRVLGFASVVCRLRRLLTLLGSLCR